MKPSTTKSNDPMGISDAAVQAKTGKTWQEWFAVLDANSADQMNHKQIVACMHKHGVGPWWGQMVTVGYERQRGLREAHQKPDGYSISRSKTIGVPADEVFTAWEDPKKRKRWLKDSDFTVRKSTPAKSLRITWTDGETTLEVNLYPKGEDKTQVTVQHNKIADALTGERMKSYWADALERLQTLLED